MKYFLLASLLVSLSSLYASENQTKKYTIQGTIYTADNQYHHFSYNQHISPEIAENILTELITQNNWNTQFSSEKNISLAPPSKTRNIYDFEQSTSIASLDFTFASSIQGNGTPVTSIDFHPSGNYLLAGGTYSQGADSRIFEISSTGSAIFAHRQCNQTYGGTINDVKWSPDGKYYALVGTVTQNLVNNVGTATFNTSIKLYQFDEQNKSSTFLPFTQIDHGTTLTSVDWHPSGNYLLVGGLYNTLTSTNESGSVRIYKFDKGTLQKLHFCIANPTNSNTQVTKVQWHPSGNYFFVTSKTGGNTYNVHLYAFITQKTFANSSLHYEENIIKINQCSISIVDGIGKLSPNGKHLCFAGNTTTTNLYVYDLFSPQDNYPWTTSLKNQSLQSAHIYDVAWSPDSSYIATAGPLNNSGHLHIFNINDQDANIYDIQECKRELGATMLTTAWSRDGSLVAVAGNTSGGSNIYVYQFTEDLNFLIKKNKSFFAQAHKKIEQNYSTIETLKDLTIQTSNSIATANPYYLTNSFTTAISAIKGPLDSSVISTTFLYGVNTYGNVWKNQSPGTSILDPSYHSWHPGNKYLALCEGSHNSNNNFIHILQRDQNILSPVSSLYFPQQSGLDQYPLDVEWNPLGKHLASRYGPLSDINQSVGKLYTFDGSSLRLTTTGTFFSQKPVSWSPNGSFLLTTTPTNLFTLLSFDGKNTYSFESGTPVLPTTEVGRGAWMHDGLSFFAWNRGAGSLGGQLYKFDSANNTISALASTLISSDSLSTVAVRPQTNDSIESGYIAIGFKESNPNLRIYSFNGITQGTPSLTILPGCSLNTTNTVSRLAWSPDGNYLAVTWNAQTPYTKVYRFETESYLNDLEITLTSNTATFTGNLSFSPDGMALMQTPSSTLAPLQSYLEYKNLQQLIIDTSNAVTELTYATTTLNHETSNAIVAYAQLNLDTSNAWIQTYSASNFALIRETSNALVSLLGVTSNAIVSLRPTMLANSAAINNLSILNYETLSRLSSYSLMLDNSSSIVTLYNLVYETSNAIAGYLVDTSNAVAGLLVATSKAINAATSIPLPLGTIDTGLAHLHFNSPSITLTYNINLSTDHQLFIHSNGIVNGNGLSITFAQGSGTQLTVDTGITTTLQNIILKNYNGQSTSLASNASLIFGDQCRVEISEPQTLLRTWSFAGNSQLNGLGNTLTLGTGSLFLSSLVNSSLQLSNLKLLNVRDNNIRTANNNASIRLQDVILNMPANTNFTYSVGSITIQNDVTIRGPSTFNYTTIMGCTINPASQLTLDQGSFFNYAPAGNFRNLLSFTDSSARLYFNNATLIATTTGPQLTKGTLLIDGIMNIQSGATSPAEAITFGNSIPADDLIITIFPGASINLNTGFLNYANAN